MPIFRVFNDGKSVQNMPDDYAAQPGDVLFDHFPTLEERGIVVDPRTDLVAYAADARWRREVAGTTVDLGGDLVVPVATDDRSKIMIMGAASAAAADEEYTTPWKTVTGAFVTLTAAQLQTVAAKVAVHVRTCFAVERSVVTSIYAEAHAVVSKDQIDAAFDTVS